MKYRIGSALNGIFLQPYNIRKVASRNYDGYTLMQSTLLP